MGWGDYTVTVRGCKAPAGHTLTCTTATSGRGNYNKAKCPSGYVVTGCGMNNHKHKWDKLSGFESAFIKSNTQCDCDSGFGTGDNTCYARCCKISNAAAKKSYSSANSAAKKIFDAVKRAAEGKKAKKEPTAKQIADKKEKEKKTEEAKKVKERATKENATKKTNAANKEKEDKRLKKLQAKAKEDAAKKKAKLEKADKAKIEKLQKSTCTITTYEHSNYRGRVETKTSICRKGRTDVRFKQYALGGRRRGYEASSIKLSSGCRMVQLWDEDHNRYGAKDNVNIRTNLKEFPYDLNDDCSGMSVWSKC